MRRIFFQLLLLVGLTLMFNACGSSDSGDSFTPSSTDNSSTPSDETGNEEPTTSDPEPSTPSDEKDVKVVGNGLFVDSIVAGLTVVSLDENGDEIASSITTEDGSYEVYEGALSLEFKLGELTLGVVPTTEVTTLFDIFRGSSVLDKRVQFVAKILLTIDDSSEDGVQLSSETIAKFNEFYSENSEAFTSFSPSTTFINTLITALGVKFEKTPTTTAEAIEHLMNAVKKLEEKISIKSASAEDCPYGGLEKVYQVDFNNDGNYETYSEIKCDRASESETVTNHTLPNGDEDCPYGGTKTHHVQYMGNIKVAEYDSYECDGVFEYNLTQTSSRTPFEANESCPMAGGINEVVTLTDPDGKVVSVYSNIYCNDFDGNYTLSGTASADRKDCPYGGTVHTFTRAVDGETYSTITCADGGDTPSGEHKTKTVTPSLDVCPMGGIEIQHEVDFDNNGDFETKYSVITCNEGNTTVSTTTAKTLVAGENSICPYGGKIENHRATYISNSEFAFEYNTTSCDDVVITEENSTASASPIICPYGGEVITTTVKMNGTTNHTYQSVRCDEINATTELKLTSLLLAGENIICPDGGKIETMVQKMADVKIAEYNVTTCSDVTIQESNSTALAPLTICPDGGEIITTTVKRNGRVAYSYENVLCSADIVITSDTTVARELNSGDNSICPDGGEINTTKIYRNGNFAYEFNTTHCFDVTVIEQNISERDATSGECPNTGKVVTTVQKRNGVPAHTYESVICSSETGITETTVSTDAGSLCPYGGEKNITTAKWDINNSTAYSYQTISCGDVEMSESNNSYNLIAGQNSICPDGGQIIIVSVSANGDEIYEYNVTKCSNLVTIIENNSSRDATSDECPNTGTVITVTVSRNGIDTYAYDVVKCSDGNGITETTVTEAILFGSLICPDGGEKNITTVKWDINNSTAYSYENISCKNAVMSQNTIIAKVLVAGENSVCPDGGEINTTKIYRNGNFAYEFNTTHCTKDVVIAESNTSEIDASLLVCPYGGKVVTTTVTRNGAFAYSYNSTFCNGTLSSREENGTEIALPFGSETCPDGGKIVPTIGYINNIIAYEYNSTFCDQPLYEESNSSEDLEIGSEICPDGGQIVTTTVKNRGEIAYTYQSIFCNGDVDIMENNVTGKVFVAGESEICPDGGSVITTEVFRNGVKTYEYNSTFCASQVLIEENNTSILEASTDDCPYGGKIITTTVTRNGAFAYDYNRTYCSEDYTITENNSSTFLVAGENSTCPYGGEIITTSVKFNDIDAYEYNTTKCDEVETEKILVDEIDIPVDSATYPECGELGGVIKLYETQNNGVVVDEFQEVVCNEG